MTNPDKKNDSHQHLKPCPTDIDGIIGNLEKSAARIREAAEMSALDSLAAGARYFAASAAALVDYVELLRKNNIHINKEKTVV